VPGRDLADQPRRRDRDRQHAARLIAQYQVGDDPEQRPARHDVAAVVDDEDLLAAGVEPDPQRRADARGDPRELAHDLLELVLGVRQPRLVDRAVQRDQAGAAPVQHLRQMREAGAFA